MEQNENSSVVTKEDIWHIDNYLLLRDYYERTISRIAARCIRMGNIALEEYPFYGYVLDVLEEICDTGNYILAKPALYPYVERKIAGGINALQQNLAVYQQELESNTSPDKLKQDPNEISKMKDALGEFSKTDDPTAGAGMNIDDVVNKLLKESGQAENMPTFEDTGDNK